ncbi:unnamed protein product [Linum tenue]|uniref:Uncharacterized protein n=1 Tax=Linum tenue TaxID=586396 RepID=A0AAV0S1B1_9ROSI|nr:unnamed protein product [Linum tenue]
MCAQLSHRVYRHVVPFSLHVSALPLAGRASAGDRDAGAFHVGRRAEIEGGAGDRGAGEEFRGRAVVVGGGGVAGGQGFRSPMSRMLSFTRILSRDWRANNGSVLSPRSPVPTSCGGSTAAAAAGEQFVEVDLERGREAAEETRPSPS